MGSTTFMSQERDNLNALRKYPFADSASCGNSSCTIPPGAIIDAQIYISEPESDVWMAGIDKTGIVHIAAGSSYVGHSECPMAADTAARILRSDGTVAGMLVFGDEYSVGVLRAAGEQSFTPEETQFALDAVSVLGVAAVTGFKLDDGNIVCGDVEFVGEDGCDVATYIDEDTGEHCLMVSAIGRAESDDTNVLKHLSVRSGEMGVESPVPYVANIYAKPGNIFDLATICECVKISNGQNLYWLDVAGGSKKTVKTSSSAVSALAAQAAPPTATLILYYPKWDADNDRWKQLIFTIIDYRGSDDMSKIDTAGPRMYLGADSHYYDFTGWYTTPWDSEAVVDNATQAYDSDGNINADWSLPTSGTVKLYSHWKSEATGEIDPEDDDMPVYGTVHLNTPNLIGYDNPLRIDHLTASSGLTPLLPSQVNQATIVSSLTSSDEAGGLYIYLAGIENLNR